MLYEAIGLIQISCPQSLRQRDKKLLRKAHPLELLLRAALQALSVTCILRCNRHCRTLPVYKFPMAKLVGIYLLTVFAFRPYCLT